MLRVTLPCINCGNCVDVCPVRLLPQELYRAARGDNLLATQELHIFDCIECGCCSYVCPSNIPLVHYYRYAKSGIAAEERRLDGADHARKRFLARNERLDAERQVDRETDRQNPPGDAEAERQSYIEAAVQRTRAKRKRSDAEEKTGLTGEDDE